MTNKKSILFRNISNRALLIWLLILLPTIITAQNAWNVSLLGQANFGDQRYSGSWSYIDSLGNEYALIGAKSGTVAYQIDSVENLEPLGFVPGPATNWREITVIENHAYVITDVMDTDHGMQVIDLSFLPDSLHLVTTFKETFEKGHMIQRDIYSDSSYVYVIGTTTTQGVHILDVSNPEEPKEIGLYFPGYYIHDCHVRGDILYACAFGNVEIDIVDISDKTNPQLIGHIPYDGKNTHSCFTTEDENYLFVADEKDGFPARIFDVSDINNVEEVAIYSANLESLVHNPYIREDYAFISHNTEGLRVVDLRDPTLPVEVGFYDTWPDSSGGFSGLWSACPFFPSGKIIGGNRHDGLYIWEFNNTQASRIYGEVWDFVTKEGIPFSNVSIPTLDTINSSNFFGEFKYGMLAGSYDLGFSAQNYHARELDIDLLEGDSIYLSIPLLADSINGGFIYGVVKDSITGEIIDNAIISVLNDTLDVETDEFGNFELILAPGMQTILVEAETYLSKEIDVEIELGIGGQYEILLNLAPISNSEEISVQKFFKFFPNPVESEKIVVEIENPNQSYFVKLYNSKGVSIYEKLTDGQHPIEISTNNLGEGTYFVSLYSEKGDLLSSEKLIVH